MDTLVKNIKKYIKRRRERADINRSIDYDKVRLVVAEDNEYIDKHEIMRERLERGGILLVTI